MMEQRGRGRPPSGFNTSAWIAAARDEVINELHGGPDAIAGPIKPHTEVVPGLYIEDVAAFTELVKQIRNRFRQTKGSRKSGEVRRARKAGASDT